MIELFSRKIDKLKLAPESRLTPLPMDEEVSSLSAILLNDEYYDFLKQGQVIIDGIPVLRPEYIIPFKAKAWLDLKERKEHGENVDSKNIRKHRNDVFRLAVFITEESRVELKDEIRADMQKFLEKVSSETIDLKNLGISNGNQNELIELLRQCYIYK